MTRSRTPDIYALNVDVLAIYGVKPAPSGQQLDEFPYASTVQGGRFGPAEADYVPRRQNSRQGGDLKAFYTFKLNWTTQPFLVVPVAI